MIDGHRRAGVSGSGILCNHLRRVNPPRLEPRRRFYERRAEAGRRRTPSWQDSCSPGANGSFGSEK